ncbi:hypothetical protein CcaverHIS641_0211370 [Cutaneotrichosporon cavernicola]|nr:hypothetical protein CcaverHIS641_0211370 [Cutaneotrichosporon cavernicola]
MFDLMDGEETDAYPASVIQTARTGNANGQALDREHDHIAHLHAELETMPVLGKERAHDHITHLRATMPPFRMHERTNAPRANAVTYTLEEWSASPTHCQGTIRIGTEAVGHGIAWEIAHAAAGGCALALVALNRSRYTRTTAVLRIKCIVSQPHTAGLHTELCVAPAPFALVGYQSPRLAPSHPQRPGDQSSSIQNHPKQLEIVILDALLSSALPTGQSPHICNFALSFGPRLQAARVR